MSSSLGVLFSLSQKEVDKLRAQPDDAARIQFIAELDEYYYEKDPERMAAIDESWEAMHRALTDGKIALDNGRFPMSHIVVGGEQLYTGDEYIISLKTPEQVKEIAASVKNFNYGGFRQRYLAIPPEEYPAYSENDSFYTWDFFQEMKPFWAQAAKEGRYVLFTVDR